MTTTPSSELKIDCYFVDGDTRTLTIKNPIDDITSSQIASLNTLIQTDNLLVGDKTGATFGKIRTATKVDKTTINYSSEDLLPR